MSESKAKESLRILLLSIAAAAVYGILHDQVTARVCVEYFSVGHPRLFPTESPTLLAFGWGIAATWWVGLILGILLARSARAGSAPPLAARMGLVALAAGLAGYHATRSGVYALPPFLAERLPASAQPGFVADLFAHQASYASGGLGGLVLCAWTLRRRLRSRERSTRSRRSG
ncbi:MAG: hypothetical protein HY293_00945 [Planctomycetes bacterium]|nr:hypothetical protein [Planctomycetota bacterium]